MSSPPLDIGLIVVACIIPFVLIFFNVLVLAHYIDPEAAAGHFIAKLAILLGMLMAEVTVLLLPLDVVRSDGEGDAGTARAGGRTSERALKSARARAAACRQPQQRSLPPDSVAALSRGAAAAPTRSTAHSIATTVSDIRPHNSSLPCPLSSAARRATRRARSGAASGTRTAAASTW